MPGLFSEKNFFLPPLITLKPETLVAAGSLLDTICQLGFNYAGLVTESFFLLRSHLVHHLRIPQGKSTVKKILEKCPRKEKADRLPEGVSIPPSQAVRGDFLPKATRGVWPNPALTLQETFQA